MNASVVSLLLGAVLASNCWASESYYTSFTAPNLVMRDTRFDILITYDVGPDNTLQGTLKDYNQTKCVTGKPRVITGKVDSTTITFESDAVELQGCGRLKFQGTKQGDNWVGTINYRGHREITFKPD